jgi:hypothetical protein
VNAHKIIGHLKKNSNQYVNLISNSLSGTSTEEQSMYGNPLSSKELKDKLQRETAGMLRRELPQGCRNIFSSCQACLEASTSESHMK